MSSKIPVLRTAPGVEFATIAPGGFRILSALDQTTQTLGFDLTITAGTDSHSTGRHVVGEAFDVSIHFLTPQQILRLRTLLIQRLGARFAVLLEAPAAEGIDPALVPFLYVNPHATGFHCHIQVRKDTDYPPSENVKA